MSPRLLVALTALCTAALASAAPAAAAAQSPADSTGIRAAALDYAEGWYAGDGDRMARAVHPELVKRILVSDTATGRAFVQTMGASALVNGARHGYGKSTPAERQQKDVRILDVFGNAAVAKIVMADWIDYLQLVRADGRWQIVNVLWEWKPDRKA
jgi:Putative lumazine-binding